MQIKDIIKSISKEEDIDIEMLSKRVKIKKNRLEKLLYEGTFITMREIKKIANGLNIPISDLIKCEDGKIVEEKSERDKIYYMFFIISIFGSIIFFLLSIIPVFRKEDVNCCMFDILPQFLIYIEMIMIVINFIASMISIVIRKKKSNNRIALISKGIFSITIAVFILCILLSIL